MSITLLFPVSLLTLNDLPQSDVGRKAGESRALEWEGVGERVGMGLAWSESRKDSQARA